jgi:membrane protein YqaA with SNARE-associated domain
MTAHDVLAALGIYAGTFAVAAISSVLPFVAIDVFLVGIVLYAPPAALPLVVVLAAAGQVVGKLPIYAASRVAGARLDRVRRWIARWQHTPRLLLFASAVFGLPPFSIISTAAGVLGVDARTFVLLVFVGRLLRFALVVAIASAAG